MGEKFKKQKHTRELSKPFNYNPPGTGNSQNSVSVSTNSNNMSFYSQDGGMGGERVRVAVRVRPLMKHERGHEAILDAVDLRNIHLQTETQKTKGYRFNAVLNEKTTQDKVFQL